MTANTVYDTKEIVLQDGKEVLLRPCSIGLLKKLMKAWEKVAEAKTEDDIFDLYIVCTGICLSREFTEEFEKTLTIKGLPTDEYKAHLEDVLDLPTIYEVLDVCGGLKLGQLTEENLAQVVETATEETPGTT